MKTKRIPHLSAAAVALVLLAFAPSLRAQVITSDPNLPVLYPTGYYATASQVFDQYHGPGLTVVLSDMQLRNVFLNSRVTIGPNEFEDFQEEWFGMISVNGSPNSPFNAFGPEQVEVFGKAGNTTGTFNTEMLSLNLSGSSPFGPFMIRESPTLASTGQTTITPLGGGQFRIDSFFDVFTELSVDGGQSWIPSDTSAHVTLMGVPEPSVCALAGLGAGLLALRGARRPRK